MLVDVALRDLADVLAVIAALGNLERARRASSCARAPARCSAEVLDLRAGVVVVELARHLPAGPLEQRARSRRRAPPGGRGRRAAARSDSRRRTRRSPARPAPRRRGRTRRPRASDRATMRLLARAGVEAEVDEARAGDLGARSTRDARQRGDEALGDLARRRFRACARAASRRWSPSRRGRGRADARARSRPPARPARRWRARGQEIGEMSADCGGHCRARGERPRIVPLPPRRGRDARERGISRRCALTTSRRP